MAGFGADAMQPIHEEAVDPLDVQRRVWRAKHKLGRHSIPPTQILDPFEVWRAREADLAHDVLMNSFQQTMMNSHGVLLVLQNNDLWAASQQ